MININLNEFFKKQKKFSGNVLLSKNNEIIFNKSYGYSNKEKGIKNTPETKFMIGSMTKSITALCIMQLSEKVCFQHNRMLKIIFQTYTRVKELQFIIF